MLTDELFELLRAHVGDSSRHVALEPGEVLFEEGDTSQSMYLVEEGALAIVIQGPDGAPINVRVTTRGDVIGEIGWMLGTRRTATVRAAEPTRLIEIPQAIFESLQSDRPHVLQTLSTLIDRRQRNSGRVQSTLPVFDALTGWKRRHRKGRAIDLVLITHPRNLGDLRSTLPWLSALDDDDLRHLSRWIRPVFGEVIDLGDFTVGLLFMPRLAEDLLDPALRAEARRIVEQDCVALAHANGARVLCLGGLTASLLQYGRRYKTEGEGSLRITTGHSVTAISCVRTMLAAAERTDGNLTDKRLAVVGAGSVGAAFLRLLSTRDVVPKEIVIVDLAAQKKRVDGLVEELQAALTDRCVVSAALNPSRGALSDDSPVYHCELVFTATSVPDVVDIAKVAPGTVLVDDSQPHCWSREDAWRRFRDVGDIVPCEAGLIDCSGMNYHSYFPFDFIEDLTAGTTHAWCCMTEGLLLTMYPELAPTLGEPVLDAVLQFDRRFVEAGLKPAPLRCGPHLLY